MMKSTSQLILTIFALTCCLGMQAADAQVVELATGDLPAAVTDPLDLFEQLHCDSPVTPVGHCTSCDPCCDTLSGVACDSCGTNRCGSGCECCVCREQLTGNWGGYRSGLAECGIVI